MKNDKNNTEQFKEQFKEKLEKVYFVVSEIPKNTDVAKYFEVMNSRGKQLEQHQVLKARFLELLKDDKEYDYAKIWDFCSDMNYYLEDIIYYNLPSEKRKENKIIEIRKDLLNININQQDILKNYFKNNGNDSGKNSNGKNNDKENISLGEILKSSVNNQSTQKDSSIPDGKEVNSIVKFSTFLLHTLRVFLHQNPNINYDIENKFSLDDKKLLEVFANKDKTKLFFSNSDEAKKFLLFLLKMRILFDYFIFKRSIKPATGEEDIKLKKIADENKEKPYTLQETDRALMNLQLLFSFTSPNYLQQEWLTPTLNFLHKELKNGYSISVYETLKSFLEDLDRNLAIKRFQENTNLKDVFDKTLENPKYKNNIPENLKLEDILNRGTSTEHYWFYKLEYLLWKKSDEYFKKAKFATPFKETKNKFEYKNIDKLYRLTRKNSIEHIWPQSKANENGWSQKSEENECQKKCHINCFGNLALISSHLNSKLIDKDFEEKREDIQKQLKNGTIESLKMLLVYSAYEEWTPDNCKKHHQKMINLLKENLNTNEQVQNSKYCEKT
ncbi:HNH endonuclease family protein [Nitratiruptor tergarcus]|uniref:HNH endonuclease family protein n=1 Tax=Nitratiruptor tergarcus TaxID=269259 RepID=UPI0009FEB6F7|nr:HNH endonuclease family protein [Nitratiruptor tergarcus]